MPSRPGTSLILDHLRYDYRQYLGEFGDHTDPRVTPLLCIDLSRAAPAVVVIAQCDPLRDEAVAYAGLLRHCGVPVELLEAKGMVHGFLEMGGVVPEALEVVEKLATHLHRLWKTRARERSLYHARSVSRRRLRRGRSSVDPHADP